MIPALSPPAPRAHSLGEIRNGALDIARDLCDRAVWHGDECTWWTRRFAYPGSYRATDRPTLLPLGNGVHEGVAGVALALTRIAAATKDEVVRETALGATRFAARLARDGPSARRLSYGAGSFGAAWVAHEVAHALDEPRLLAFRDALIDAAWRGRRNAHEPDLNVGVAGALAPLLRIAVEDGHDGARRLASWSARYLLRNARRAEASASWPQSRRAVDAGLPDLTGFSHGAAGVGWALAQYAAATGDETAATTARAAFAYERAQFDETRGEWRDLRGPRRGGAEFSGAWCYGAAGQGVARRGAYRTLGDEVFLHEARAAAEATRAINRSSMIQPGENLCLCHGVSGNADALWLAADLVDPLGARQEARGAADWILERYGSRAGVPLPLGSHGFLPSLMTGAAGVGLFLLRVATEGAVETALHPPTLPRLA